jgi:hypothetical protein
MHNLLTFISLQMTLASATGTWPLLQLVSIGCHASMSELLVRLASFFRPQPESEPESAHWEASVFSTANLLGMKLPTGPEDLLAPTDTSFVTQFSARFGVRQGSTDRSPPIKTFSEKRANSPSWTTAFLARSATCRNVSRLRSFAEASKLVATVGKQASQAHRDSARMSRSVKVQKAAGAEDHAEDHEYPILFMVSVANTMLNMFSVRLCPVSDNLTCACIRRSEESNVCMFACLWSLRRCWHEDWGIYLHNGRQHVSWTLDCVITFQRCS